jgi:hypothetical protein
MLGITGMRPNRRRLTRARHAPSRAGARARLKHSEHGVDEHGVEGTPAPARVIGGRGRRGYTHNFSAGKVARIPTTFEGAARSSLPGNRVNRGGHPVPLFAVRKWKDRGRVRIAPCWGLKHVFGRPNANGAAGATLMKVDLQKVDAEIAALRSRLAAIIDHLDECRVGYFEHPWAWSQTRRALTSERHRVQRRLDELTFVRKCVGGPQLWSIPTPSFRSLINPGQRDVDLHRLTFRLIQGGRS